MCLGKFSTTKFALCMSRFYPAAEVQGLSGFVLIQVDKVVDEKICHSKICLEINCQFDDEIWSKNWTKSGQKLET